MEKPTVVYEYTTPATIFISKLNEMMDKGKILIVDDNEELLLALKLMIAPHFSLVQTETNPESIPNLLKKDFDIVLLDMNFKAGVNTGNEGLYWLRKINDLNPSVSVIFITAYGDLDLGVKSIKEGAADFIQKSWDQDKILSTIIAVYKLNQSKKEISRLRKKQSHLKSTLDAGYIFYKGSSQVMQKVYETIDKVAPTDANILVLGENGTGKELVARDIHHRSSRRDEIFVKVDLGALHENLFESELFGHEKGAFTDAKQNKAGRFEIASGGSLFLDEIGNLTLPLQSKLLSAIQNREIIPLGASRPIPIDVRLICATNKPLYEMVEEGAFREDLLYRINTIQVEVPPLRERGEDIPHLAKLFLHDFAAKYAKSEMTISKLALEKISKYPWYGNVRELSHGIEKAVILSNSEVLKSGDFNFNARSGESSGLKDSYNIAENEKKLIKDALNKFEWNLSRTSRALGINRSTLYDKINKYGL